MGTVPQSWLPLRLSLMAVEETGTVIPVSQMRVSKVQEVKQSACEKTISAQVYVTSEQSELPFHSYP